MTTARDTADATNDEPDHVVTAFLRNRGEILVCKRSDAVGTYPGAWGGVSGFAEDEPDEQVWREIDEETGLTADEMSLVRAGRPVSVSDPEIDREWVVHPYLFDAASREIDLSEEHTEAAWIPPTALAGDDAAGASGTTERETVPKLWATYERVAPTVRSIAADDDHGAAWLSIRAMEVLRDRAGLLLRERAATADAEPDSESAVDPDGEWDELAAVGNRLLESRPSMAVLRNRVNQVMAEASTDGEASAETDTPDAGSVLEAAVDGIERAVAADADAAGRATEVVTGRLLTLSWSGTVHDAILAGEPDRVFVAASQPGREGVATAETLADATAVTLCPDAAVAHVLAEEGIDAVLVGADTILPDGRVVNKTGTRAATLAAAREDVPVYAVAASDKISTRETVNLESGDRTDVYDGDARIDVTNPTFDVTPADCVTGIVTDRGILEPADTERIAAEFRENETWS
ncbi:translation initiation factor 2B subunit, eIF-2B alpha/beta/delta family [Halovivax ruber XH-70]|uniref:Translation initiation factor 2B subunit, eIF-2B alpha/beta/delta family n=1 Tax=Halovivax ruber (strain DSM 18193 / JCM 13892 / XH-70) TaxID=797302 RepID=L0IEQ8_HALRX|nr:NUDIX domain-containing protein [Halovivax ruber]AGB17298.1 translation initiation factor 2B subunit, eIF-2B alpha/beta/delta family [Halovivax ruber XH-70]